MFEYQKTTVAVDITHFSCLITVIKGNCCASVLVRTPGKDGVTRREDAFADWRGPCFYEDRSAISDGDFFAAAADWFPRHLFLSYFFSRTRTTAE